MQNFQKSVPERGNKQCTGRAGVGKSCCRKAPAAGVMGVRRERPGTSLNSRLSLVTQELRYHELTLLSIFSTFLLLRKPRFIIVLTLPDHTGRAGQDETPGLRCPSLPSLPAQDR